MYAEPVQDPSIAIGPDGTAHFAWWSDTRSPAYENPCAPPESDGSHGSEAAFYAFIEPITHQLHVDDPVSDRSRPRLGVGYDNTLFVAWQKCNTTTGYYHPAFDWAPANSWLDVSSVAPFTFTTIHEDVNPVDPRNSSRYVDDAEAPFLFVSQEHGQSRLHLVWERYDTTASSDAAPPLYYVRPVTDDKPITAVRDPDPRLQTTNISIADYAGQFPSMHVFDVAGNIEAHVIWQSKVDPNCDMYEIDWGYAPGLPPSLTTAEPGSVPNPWLPAEPISFNGAAKRAAKGPVSCSSITRTAIFPATATGPDDGVYAVWNEWVPGSEDYTIMASHLVRGDPAGLYWDAPVTVTTASRTMLVQSATAVDKRGRQYVLWNEGFDKIELKGMDSDGGWQTTPIQLNRGPWCEGTPNASSVKVGKVGLTYDSVQDKLHAIWVATTPTSSSPSRLCYATVDVNPYQYHSFLPLVSQAATPHVSAAPTSGIRPLARP
ncbi:MAG: hypothetical protein U0822_20695 [Anaerolineae bacterium]